MADPVTGRPISEPYTSTRRDRKSTGGLAFGGGNEHGSGRLRVDFDARVTWWADRETVFYGIGRKAPIQVAFLFGVGF